MRTKGWLQTMVAVKRVEQNIYSTNSRCEPTYFGLSLTNVGNVCCSLWEAFSQNAPCFISAAIERYDSSTPKKNLAVLATWFIRLKTWTSKLRMICIPCLQPT